MIQTGLCTRQAWQPTRRRAWPNHPRRRESVEPDATRVARPVRRGLTGLTPLRKREINPCVLPDAIVPPWSGATRKRPAFHHGWSWAVNIEVVQIHPRGSGPKGLVQPRPAWGVRRWRHLRPGTIILGYPPKQRNAKSSTMKGPQGLAGHRIRRRSRTGTASTLLGYGGASGSCPQKSRCPWSWKLRRCGSPDVQRAKLKG